MKQIEFRSGFVAVIALRNQRHCYFLNGEKSTHLSKSARLAELSASLEKHPEFKTAKFSELSLSGCASSEWIDAVHEWAKKTGLNSKLIRKTAEGQLSRLEYSPLDGSLKTRSDSQPSASAFGASAGSVVSTSSSGALALKPIESVKILIVDDSKAMRMALKKALSSDSRIQVIGEAASGPEGLALIEKLKPDAMTLDIQMPEMSGVEMLMQMNKTMKSPTPAVMVSALGMNEGREVLNALEAGAFDYFQKPEASELMAQGAVLAEKLVLAVETHRTQLKKTTSIRSRPQTTMTGSGSPSQGRIASRFPGIDLLCIGASTGGTEAIRKVFDSFPEVVPPTVIVQHIPPVFSKAFADRLNSLNPFEVREAVDGDVLKEGLVLVAPGGMHVELQRIGQNFVVRLSDAPPVNRFKPSVDVMFHSAAKLAPKFSIAAVILTGMGSDGAKGLLALRQAGARTIGQDEDTCVVYGMPRAAFELGAVEEVLPLGDIAQALTFEKKNSRATKNRQSA